jgi:hypothetical protein
MTRIFHWSGEYFGFITNDRLFDLASNYLGWVTEDGRVWKRDGRFLGEVVNDNYILRRTSMAEPAIRATRAIPATPAIPALAANRAARAIRAGWTDALSEL